MEKTKLYERRLKKVENILAERGVGCLLLNQTQTIEFLTGANITCSWIFITKGGKRIALVLESDFRNYKKHTFLKDIRTFTPHDPKVHFQRIPDELGLGDREIALEKDHLRYSQFEMIKKFMGSKINLNVNADHIVQEARIIKTPAEIQLIWKASQLACYGYQIAQDTIRRGVTEKELAEKIRQAMVDEGAGKDTYIYLASIERSCLAHAHPTRNRLEGGPIVIDIHANYEGYHADMARTIFLEGSPREQVRTYELFRDRVLTTIHSLKSGSSLQEAKKTFHRGIKKNNDMILLSGPLLHGVGIVNYELPRFDHPFENKGYPQKLMTGMVLACTNIGMCSRQGWSIRFEDTFVINRENLDILTSG
jgi:Xaa-Pro aminopeptidase